MQTIAINAKGDLFAGTNGQGVFRSTDHGESWVQVNTGIASKHRNIRALAVDSTTDSLFAGTSSSGLYRFSNNGNTWTPLPTGLTGAATIQALAIKHGSGVVFAGTDSRGILRSTNNGDTWAPIDTSSIFRFLPTAATIGRSEITACVVTLSIPSPSMRAITFLPGRTVRASSAPPIMARAGKR